MVVPGTLNATQRAMGAEVKARHLRFFRELIGEAVDAHRRVSLRGQVPTPNMPLLPNTDKATLFMGAMGLFFQAEHVHRTHDIPSMDFRGDTAFEYLVGGGGALGAQQPLFPMGLARVGPRTHLPGGMATCALFSVVLHPLGDQHAASQVPPMYKAVVDIFVPLDEQHQRNRGTATNRVSAAASEAERHLWHHDAPMFASGGAPWSDGSQEEIVSLFHRNDATYTCRVHDHHVASVARRLWDVLRQAHTSTEGQYAQQVGQGGAPSPTTWTPEQLTGRYDLPYLVTSCPTVRSCGGATIAPCSLHDIVQLAAPTPPSLRIPSGEEDALKRERIAHPASGVLGALLLYRKHVGLTAPPSDAAAQGEGASPPPSADIEAALFQYALPPPLAQAWGVPSRWAPGPMVSAAAGVVAPFVDVTHAVPHAAAAVTGMSRRMFLRSRTTASATPLVDRLRACKSPFDAAMFLRSAFVTRSCFLEGVRVCGASQRLALPVGEGDILRAMIRGGWSAAKPQPNDESHNSETTVRTTVFGYPPVVAAGRNALAVHYTAAANASVHPRNWVLVDAGAEVHGIYTTDCTRCWPCGAHAVRSLLATNSKEESIPSPQQLVYQATLTAQQRILCALHPGMTKKELRDISKTIVCHEIEILFKKCRAMLDDDDVIWCAPITNNACQQRTPLSFSPSAVSSYISDAHEAFTMHSVGHFTGFDIHERGPMSAALDPGTMHTIEPGMYFRGLHDALLPALLSIVPALQSLEVYVNVVPRQLGGIGMRVEDSVLMLPRPTSISPSHTAGCGATRGEYLNALLEEYCSWQHIAMPHSTSVDYAERQRVARASFVQWQSDAIGNHSPQTIIPTEQQQHQGVACDTDEDGAWYPYHMVVITAAVPKSLEALQDTLRGDDHATPQQP